MRNKVIIKLYREIRDSVWRDICERKEDEELFKLKEFCRQNAILYEFVLIDDLYSGSVGEILYEKQLTEEQKEYFMRFFRKMNEDGEPNGNEYNLICRPIRAYFYQMVNLEIMKG